MLGVGGLALCLFLWKQFVPAHQVWLACLLAQLGLFLLLASRFWQRGIEATLVMSADPPIVAVEEIAAMEEEEMSVAAGPEAFAGLSEPTLRELVQKLRTQPLAGPEAVPVAQPRPSPENEPAPAPVDDPAKVNEPQISILDRHATKFPLGGVSPEKEAADPVENENVPDDPDRHATKFLLGGASPEKEAADPVEKESAPGDPEAPPRHGIPLP